MRALLLLAILAATELGQPAAYRGEIEQYRRHRLEELTAPNGWLAVRGLFWLHAGENSAGSDSASEIRMPARAPKRLGVFTLIGGKVIFTPDRAAHVQVADQHVDGPTALTGGESGAVVSARVSLFLIRRGDRVGLRMLDPDSKARRTFSGLRYY